MPAKGAGQAQAKRPPLKLVYGQLVQPAERNRMGNILDISIIAQNI